MFNLFSKTARSCRRGYDATQFRFLNPNLYFSFFANHGLRYIMSTYLLVDIVVLARAMTSLVLPLTTLHKLLLVLVHERQTLAVITDIRNHLVYKQQFLSRHDKWELTIIARRLLIIHNQRETIAVTIVIVINTIITGKSQKTYTWKVF